MFRRANSRSFRFAYNEDGLRSLYLPSELQAYEESA